MRLFHFSDDAGIARFEPRPVRIPSPRPAGRDWLNGPLVWAIDEPHQPMYLFPRDCPRILLWPHAATTETDRARWIGDTQARVVAFIEAAWAPAQAQGEIHRYELPREGFEDLGDSGMWVRRTPVAPIARVVFTDLTGELEAQGGELRLVESLQPLRAAYGSSLGFNGLRLRHSGQPPPQPDVS